MTTSMEERQDMAKKFQSIDKDRSGFIDKTELIAAYQ
jgi:Ca2+-binding EF-hand superfamily protein